ncbi:MAG TPA: glycosyltransferase family 4 protein [Steroidobacteraceae bacterium]|nr:glycosyltransferase family 4 protein [Steroidobacteraceae bacterium]
MPRQPRICWLTEEFFPPDVGGMGVITGALSQGIAAQGLEVRVITRQTQPPVAVSEWLDKVEVRRIPPAEEMKGTGLRAIPLVLGYLLRLIVLLSREAGRYDVVIISGMKIIPLVAVPLGRLLRKKIIVRVESPFELAEPISGESTRAMNNAVARLLSRVLRRMQLTVLRNSSCVIAISKDMEVLLQRTVPGPARVVDIPNAIDLSRFRPVLAADKARLRAVLGIPADKSVVVYAGRLSRSKGILLLMEAFREVAAGCSELHLVVVGGGLGSWDECESEVHALAASEELRDRVTLAGPSDRVHEYFQASDLFMLPSDYEGFGLTLVEALACGLPAVATSVGVAPQIIRAGVNGFLCPPKDSPALAEALRAALRRRTDWLEMGRHSREAVAHFDIQQVSARYVSLCRELTGCSRERKASAERSFPR